ncbi:MAG TPA: hypothetical protein VHZ30_07180 [Verrucomicrobiae bacterium]|nr:hypothetical protein [Verrucomicrobiae bacterium]
MKTSRWFFNTVVAAVLLFAVASCSRVTHISTRAAGHDIAIEIEGNHSLDAQTDRAVIASQFGKITVESSRVQLGEGPWTKIPTDVPMLVGISKHKQWVKAGAVSIKETSS